MITFTLMSMVSIVVYLCLFMSTLGLLGSFLALNSVKAFCNPNMELRDFLKPTVSTLMKLYIMRTGMVHDMERSMFINEDGQTGMDSRWKFISRVSNYRFLRFSIVFGAFIFLSYWSHSFISMLGFLIVGLFSYDLDKTWLKIAVSNMALVSEVSNIVPPGAVDDDKWDDDLKF